jgi:hypothetical protein
MTHEPRKQILLWGLTIRRVANGYVLEDIEAADPEDPTLAEERVIAEKEDDELAAGEAVLWEVANYFGMLGSKYDQERLTITREPGEKHES